MAATEAIGPGAAFKDEGNEFFKQGEHLKAAASYTKAIKAEPLNHVYYSNRSQAFLKLSKITKAVEDADKCIQLAPDFVKGYHRKAAALAALNDEEKKILKQASKEDL
jgi:stress-induced-phosphoprotein 1